MSPASPASHPAEPKPLPEMSESTPSQTAQNGFVPKPLSALPPPAASNLPHGSSQFYSSPFQYPASGMNQTLPFIAYKPQFPTSGYAGQDPFAYGPMNPQLPQKQPVQYVQAQAQAQYPLQVLPIPPLMDGSRQGFSQYPPQRVSSHSPPTGSPTLPNEESKNPPSFAPSNHLLRPTYMYGEVSESEPKAVSETNTHGKLLMRLHRGPHEHSPKSIASSSYKSRPYICTHEDCSWSFSRQSDLRRHAKTHRKPTFECPYWSRDNTCHRNGGSFSRLDVLKRHLRLVHYIKDKQRSAGLSDPGWCKACQKVFPSSKMFITHCTDCAANLSTEDPSINK